MTDKKSGIYVHIPFCKSKCKYCAFVSTPDFSLQKKYVDALLREIEQSRFRGTACDTVYIGGGTPSCLFEGGISSILNALYADFAIENDAEITVECNPESVNERFIAECLSLGVNRVSMGLQCSDDNVLRNIGRIHDFNCFLSAIRLLSKSFDNISSDLILGLPGQSTSDIERSINVLSDYCSHVSVYALAVEDGTPLGASGYSVDDDIVADMYDRAVDMLRERGYSRYEVSNFARDGKQSRHNLKYWRNMPYLGFGVAAHGFDGVDKRYAHGNDILEYIEDPTPKYYELSYKDRFNEYVMLALRTERGIDLEDFEQTFGRAFFDVKGDETSRLSKSGYIVADDRFLRINDKYMFVMNGIIEDLMID